jgi:hypothetical protein
MSWRELTEDDILGVLSAGEIAGYQVASPGQGQDPMQDAIAGVVGMCRGYIADNPSNRLEEGMTLPERVMLPAKHLIRVELLTRLDLEVSEDRRRAATQAIRFFERVSEGKVAIEQPTGDIEQADAHQTMETISKNERQATREKLSGL